MPQGSADVGMAKFSETVIGIDGRYLQDKWHGVGRYTYGLLAGLCAAEGNYRVVVFVDPSLPNHRFPLHDLAAGGKIELYPISFGLHSPYELVAWQAVLRARPVDVFHSPYVWSPLLLPCPLVTTVHDMIFDRYPEYMPGRRYWLPYKAMSRLAVGLARQVIAVSEATKADLLHFVPARAGKVVTVLEGVEQHFKPAVEQAERDRVRAKYSLPQRYVLALGARRPHKNVSRLVQAFRSVAADVEHTLVLAGAVDARFDDDAAQAIEELRAAGRVLEIGHIDEADLATVYSLAELFVQPSVIEGFGLPVLEAMACGCPVACSNTSSLPEVAGDAALLFDPWSVSDIAATLCRALATPTLRSELSALGLERANRFTWRSAAQQTLKIYTSAAA